MCGICGIISSESQVSERIGKMMQSLIHRGPDSEGAYSNDNRGVAVGMRRLKVIDPKAGEQPFFNEDKSLVCVINGEIYNFQTLRKGLIERGHTLHSHSDGEVIVHLYEEMGEKLLKHLDGMFAIALYDTKSRKLFLARDRFGKKPLYYLHRNREFLFGSEIKAIRAGTDIPFTIDDDAVFSYLNWSYIPHPHSVYREVRKLPPGHFLTVINGKEHLERYYHLSYREKRNISFHDATEGFKEQLMNALVKRLKSDVPLGLFLSGGLDSSALVALLSEYTNQSFKTFSIGFADEGMNELPYADEVAEKYGTEHHTEIVSTDIASVLDDLVWHYNEPYGNSSAVPAFALCKMARKEITVSLSGDGADETLGGYLRYRENKFSPWFSLLPLPLQHTLEEYFLTKVSSLQTAIPLQKLLTRMGRSVIPGFKGLIFRENFPPAFSREILTDRFQHALSSRFSASFTSLFKEAQHGSSDNTGKMLLMDILQYLPCDNLNKMDIASMAHSLEVRSPFLDHHLVEYEATLPSYYSCDGRSTKRILKALLEQYYPLDFVHRKKQGFTPPLSRWLREDINDLLRDCLIENPKGITNYIRHDALRKMYGEFADRKRDHAQRLWLLLMFELWFRRFHLL